MYSHTSADEVPSDHVLWQFAQPVAQQTKNWARLALYLGLLPADAASTQPYQVHMQFTYMYGDVHTVYMYVYMFDVYTPEFHLLGSFMSRSCVYTYLYCVVFHRLAWRRRHIIC